jgi:hypothetical protein
MYAVIRAPIPNAAFDPQRPKPGVEQVLNNHLPTDSQLYDDITNHSNTDFLWLNLQCSAAQSGAQAVVNNSEGKPTEPRLDCGSSGGDKVPYFVFLALMIGTTFYQQRQMQRASPAGSQQQQQQMMARIMPLFFGVIGFSFPAGLILYWTTTNGVQIVQQHYMFVRRGMGPGTDTAPEARSRSGAGAGFMARLMRASEARSRAAESRKPVSEERGRKPQGSGRGKRSGSTGGDSKRSTREPDGLRGQPFGTAKPSASKGKKPGSSPSRGAGGGGSRNAGDRKKRRKR